MINSSLDDITHLEVDKDKKTGRNRMADVVPSQAHTIVSSIITSRPCYHGAQCFDVQVVADQQRAAGRLI